MGSRVHEHVPPETCKGGVDRWVKGDCPPTLIKAEHRDGSEPLFKDMTAHAREYLKLNPREETQPRQWLENHEFREGASREIPIEYERLRRMLEPTLTPTRWLLAAAWVYFLVWRSFEGDAVQLVLSWY